MEKSKNLVHAATILLSAIALTVILLLISPETNQSYAASSDLLPKLTATLGVSGGAAAAIWNAYNSWWAAALGLALIPLGFGVWATTIRVTFNALVKKLGKKAARQAALRF